jgi:hypothetical protein
VTSARRDCHSFDIAYSKLLTFGYATINRKSKLGL